MEETFENIKFNKMPKTQFSIKIKNDNEKVNIIINEKQSTIELAAEIIRIFQSIILTCNSLVLDLSRIERFTESIYLTALNIALVSKKNGISCKIIFDMDNIGCTNCSLNSNSKDRICDLCISKLDCAINYVV